jgi:hypothetical protein
MTDVGAAVREILLSYLEPLGKDTNPVLPGELLAGYMNVHDAGHRFSGRAFDTYGSCESHPDAITGSDLVAVTFLSMNVGRGGSGITPEAAIQLHDRRAEITGLLSRIDPSMELHELDARSFEDMLSGVDAPGRRLFELVHEILMDDGSKRPVATYKLIARKRPGLFPIRDGVAAAALKPHGNSRWWRPWWEALRGPDSSDAAAELVRRVEVIRDEAGARHLTVLRTLDILIWMRDRGVNMLPEAIRRRAET